MEYMHMRIRVTLLEIISLYESRCRDTTESARFLDLSRDTYRNSLSALDRGSDVVLVLLKIYLSVFGCALE